MAGGPDALLLPLVHLGLTCFMTGLIWFVQLVHYPLFAGVGRDGFAAYEREHVRRVSWVVGPAMLAEAATAAALVWGAPPGPQRAWMLCNAGLLTATWLSTALWQVPLHEILKREFDGLAAKRLARTNWVRTVCWSVRCALLIYGFPAVVATMAFAPSGVSPR